MPKPTEQPEEYDFYSHPENSRKELDSYCVVFGCGRLLSLMENLYGGKCVSCMSKKKIDPTLIIKFR